MFCCCEPVHLCFSCMLSRLTRGRSADQQAAVEDGSLLRTRVVALSAEGRLRSASVFLADGSLLVPEAYACALLLPARLLMSIL